MGSRCAAGREAEGPQYRRLEVARSSLPARLRHPSGVAQLLIHPHVYVQKKYDSFRGPEVIVSPMLKTRAFLNWGELLNLALERFGNFKFNAQTRKTILFNAERPNAPRNSFTRTLLNGSDSRGH